MPAANYLACAGVAFLPPVHPGNAPIHVANATGNQINETNRQYKHDLIKFQLFSNLNTTLKQQLLAAIDVNFLCILEDTDFGFTDVLPSTMLMHLKDTYSQISRDEIKENLNKLSMDLNVDDPIEALWLCLKEIQCFAIAASEPITDDTVIRLTLPIFKETGVFDTVTEKWRNQPGADWTLDNFKTHFEKGNKERLQKLTAKTAGYHGANAAVPMSDSSVAKTSPTTIITNTASQGTAAATTTLTTETSSICTNNNVTMYYCWLHGLGKNRAHTSTTCHNKHEGCQGVCTKVLPPPTKC
jgi:hypothetical protein